MLYNDISYEYMLSCSYSYYHDYSYYNDIRIRYNYSQKRKSNYIILAVDFIIGVEINGPSPVNRIHLKKSADLELLIYKGMNK